MQLNQQTKLLFKQNSDKFINIADDCIIDLAYFNKVIFQISTAEGGMFHQKSKPLLEWSLWLHTVRREIAVSILSSICHIYAEFISVQLQQGCINSSN